MTLLIGRYEYSLDGKHRLGIPPKFRDALRQEKGRGFYLTSGLEGCLYLFLPSQWSRLLENDLQAFSLPDKEQERAFKRKFFSEAVDVELDGAGTILRSQYPRDHTGCMTRLVSQEAGKRAEIWDIGRWKAYSRSKVEPTYRRVSRSLEI